MEAKEDEDTFFDCPEICPIDEYDQNYAKEKASILWLLSKAFNGDIPNDLREPFYRDHDNIRRLKPKIVHSLATAELYCLALVNIFSDPNYHNLDHQGIIQALLRGGVCLTETREASLTETILVQTAPIRLNAHMVVIDGIMFLFIKEVLIPEKIVEVVRKLTAIDVNSEMPRNAEEAGILWINKCCKALEQEIKSECSLDERTKLPKIPILKDISDISDGCCLAAVISYYCPTYLRWQDICWNDPMSLGDSIYNLQLIKKFCSEVLPKEIIFLTLEDLLYLHVSIKENVLALISDLLYMFCISRANCVTLKKKAASKEPSHLPLENSKSLSNFPSHKSQVLCSPIPNLRADSYGGSTSSLPDIRSSNKARTYSSKERLNERTLNRKSNFSNEELVPNQLQRTNSAKLVNGWKSSNLPYVDSGDSISGSPRHVCQEQTRPAVEGESASSNLSHPSTRSTEELCLNKNVCHNTRTDTFPQNSPQRDSTGYGLRKFSEGLLHSGSHVFNGVQEQSRGRKSLEDYYNQLANSDVPLRSISATNISENKKWRNASPEKFSPKSQAGESIPGSASSQSSGICLSDIDSRNNFSTTSFAQLSKLRDTSSHSINIVYTPHEKEMLDKEKNPSSPVTKKTDVEGKKTTFAALPNTTTWQQQHAVNSNFPQTDSGHETPTEVGDNLLNVQLCNIKMKLEEKKRKIELKKKRMELMWKKQRQKMLKTAFLQAVSKNPNAEAGTPDSGTGKEVTEVDFLPPQEISVAAISNSPSMVKRMSMQEIAEDLDSVQKKWLHHIDAIEQLTITDNTNDLGAATADDNDTINIDLQTSIEQLNTSLTDLQADISRISLQQEQVESLMKDSIDDGSHFFLHGNSSNSDLNSPRSRGPINLNFEDSTFLLKRRIYVEPSGIMSTPQSFNNYNSDVEPSFSLPPCSNLTSTPAPEELYSKVNKPDKYQKQTVPHLRSNMTSSNKVLPSESTVTISNDYSKRPGKSKPSNEIHIVLPSVPDPKCDEHYFPKKSKEEKKGFYIPIEKEDTETEMQRKKEMIMNLSIQRKAEYERKRAQKEQEYARLKEEERKKQEYQERKREEEKRRREAILEQYRQRKIQEELEKDGLIPHKDGKFHAKSRTRRESKPRPKSAYVHMNSDLASLVSMGCSAANKRNSQIFPVSVKEMQDFDLDSLNSASTSASSHDRPKSPNNFFPPRHTNLPLPEGSGPSSDGASDTASNGSSAAAGDYTGPKLFVKPTAKSNRNIIINAINTVLAGAVNADTKKKVIEEINRCESKHFLILFRDAGCQFRAIYTYNPEREEVLKLFGIGPKNITDKMMDRFYKYNSGGKCFSEIQTKHLTVTIDAFTIPNSLWAGKKVIPPRKEFF